MQLGKKARRLVTAIVAGGSISAAVVSAAAPAMAADQLPAYTRGYYCTTRTLNIGQPSIKGETCTGFYKVTKATYKFTQDTLHLCPRMGISVHLDERWISPPIGGAPTILASYHAYL